MLLIIALTVVTANNDTPKLFQSSFGPIQEVIAKTGDYARTHARPVAPLQPYVDSIFRCFKAGATDGRLLSIRLAINSGNRWMFVDERGIAKLDGQFGHFDVVSWELLIRRLPTEINVRRSPLVRLSIRNETSSITRFIDSAGFERAVVGPRDVANVLTWFGDHKVWVNGRYAGLVGRLFEAAHSKGAFGLEFRGSPGWDFEVSPMPAQIKVSTRD